MSPEETDAQLERRLMRECSTIVLEVIPHHNPWPVSTQWVRVEVVFHPDDTPPWGGYYIVAVPAIDPSDDDDLAHHPATLATDTITEHLSNQSTRYEIYDVFPA